MTNSQTTSQLDSCHSDIFNLKSKDKDCFGRYSNWMQTTPLHMWTGSRSHPQTGFHWVSIEKFHDLPPQKNLYTENTVNLKLSSSSEVHISTADYCPICLRFSNAHSIFHDRATIRKLVRHIWCGLHQTHFWQSHRNVPERNACQKPEVCCIQKEQAHN